MTQEQSTTLNGELNGERISSVGDRTSNVSREPSREDTYAKQPLTTSGETVERHEVSSASILPQQDTAQANERWQRIQAQFVDDPRRAVGDAHALVGELVQRIVDAFTKERGDLEAQWSRGDDVSTEELRVCLQNYRAFFSRLLPSANGLEPR
jgi:hypothetical protein